MVWFYASSREEGKYTRNMVECKLGEGGSLTADIGRDSLHILFQEFVHDMGEGGKRNQASCCSREDASLASSTI